MDLMIAGVIVAGLACVAFGWVLGQIIYIFLPDDRFDVWDDDDW